MLRRISESAQRHKSRPGCSVTSQSPNAYSNQNPDHGPHWATQLQPDRRCNGNQSEFECFSLSFISAPPNGTVGETVPSLLIPFPSVFRPSNSSHGIQPASRPIIPSDQPPGLSAILQRERTGSSMPPVGSPCPRCIQCNTKY